MVNIDELDFDTRDKKVFRENVAKLDLALHDLELDVKFLELGADEENLEELKAMFYNSQKKSV